MEITSAKFNFYPTTNAEGDTVIRTGEALKPEYPLAVNLSGTITAPGDFAEKRKSEFNALTTNVQAHYANRTITLRTDEQNRYAHTVIGKLELHPFLTQFSINTNKYFTRKSLYDMLKMQRAFFQHPDQHATLLTRLTDFSAKVDTEIQQKNDFKGSQAQKRVVEIKHDLQLQFDLAVPLFTGFDIEKFVVDICVDFIDGSVTFWLESVELHEMLIAKTEEIFDEQLKRLEEYIIIKQY